MPAADVLSAADVAEFGGLLRDLAWPDAYEIKRPGARVSDGRGGFATTEATVEAGPCRLKRGGIRGDERAAADRLGWTSHYAVDLRRDTLLTPADALTVNGRRFEVGEVLRGGDWDIAARAVVRETG